MVRFAARRILYVCDITRLPRSAHRHEWVWRDVVSTAPSLCSRAQRPVAALSIGRGSGLAGPASRSRGDKSGLVDPLNSASVASRQSGRREISEHPGAMAGRTGRRQDGNERSQAGKLAEIVGGSATQAARDTAKLLKGKMRSLPMSDNARKALSDL